MDRITRDNGTGNRKEQILNAALNVFTRKGYGEARVPDIAKEAGVAVGTIYNYFESKREILVSLMINRFFTRDLLKMLDDKAEQNEQDFIEGFFKDRLTWGTQNVDKILLILSEVNRDDEVKDKWTEQILHPVMKKLTEYVKSRMDEGYFEKRDPDLVARSLAGLGMGFIILYSMEGDRSPIKDMDLDELAGKLADLILSGLRGAGGERANEGEL
ncbi:MAG: TetR/AcrR family transcriptional regulator [Dehalococcoidia bacterium]